MLGLSAIPPYLAESYVDSAYAGWQGDLDRAYEDLDRAASLNRLADRPLVAEGAIASAAGDHERSIDSFEQAIERKPAAWESHYFLALELARSDPGRARAELDAVRRLNPGTERLRALRRALAEGPAGGEAARQP